MTLQNTLIILAIFINLILVFSLLKYAKKSRSRTYFLLFLFSMLAWSAAELSFRLIPGGNIDLATKFLYVAASFIPTSFMLFALTYPDNKPIRKGIIVLTFLELLMVDFLIISTPKIIQISIPDSNQNHLVVFGSLYFLYVFHITAPFLFGLFALAKKHIKTHDVTARGKIADVLVGSITTFILGTTSDLFAPYLGINNIDWLGPIFTFAIVIFVVKGMLSEKILGARIFIQRKLMSKAIIFSLLLAYLGALYLMYLFYHFVKNTSFVIDGKTISHLVTFFLAFLIVLLFLTAILISQSKKDIPRRIFIIVLFILCGWLMSLIGSELVSEPGQALRWARLPYFFILWFPPTYIIFFYYIFHKKLPRSIVFFVLLAISSLLLVISQTSLYIKEIIILPNGSQELVTGSLYAFDSAYYLLAIFGSAILTVIKRKRLDEGQKRILRIMVPTYTLALIPTVVTQTILPALGYSYFYAAFGTVAGMFMVVFGTFIAIYREKFLNIKLRIQRRAFHRSIALLMTLIYLSLIFLISQVISVLKTRPENIFTPIIQNLPSLALIILLIAFVTYLIAKKRETRTQKTFIYLILAVIATLFGVVMSSIAPSDQILLWERLTYLGIGWIPSLIFLLFYFFITEKSISRKQALAIFAPAIILITLAQTPLVIQAVIQDVPWNYNDIRGPLYSIEAAYYLVAFLAVTYICIRYWQKLNKEKKRQTWFLLVGYLAAVLPSLVTNVILPNFYDVSQYYQTAFGLGVLIFVLVTSTAVLKFKFLKIKIYLTAALVRRFLATILVIIILPLLIWFLFIKQYFPQNTTGRIITIAFIVFALFPLFNRLLENFINKTIFKNTKTPAEIINSVVEKISTTLNTNLITKILLEELTMQLNLSGTAYLAKTNSHFEFQRESNFPEAINLARFVYTEKVALILKQENSYTQESLRKLPDAQNFLRILEATNTEVIVPFKIENELVGLLVLKEKKHNEAFSKDELHILDTLSFHLAATIHNAVLFAKVKNFAHDLEKKVEQATNELKEKNEELAKVHEEKSQFFADIAHEFKTPITVMKGNIDILAPNLPQDQGSALQKEVHRMNQLTTDLLELSRAETGQIELHYENVDLKEIISSVISEIQMLAHERKIFICNQVNIGTQIAGDRTRLRQIILNLLTNAIKYNKENGRIEISIRDNENQICLSVADTGIGIPKDQLSKVFERFFRVDKSYSKRQGGTGLGLAIVKLMTELHGGTVSVQSEEGKGTKFTVCLPKSQAKIHTITKT